MTPWEVAKYLIDAKKDIDSMLYFRDNLSKFSLQIRKFYVDRTRDDFYIKCCDVLDEYIAQSGVLKKELCENNEILKRLYHERDKNSAHLDKKYVNRNYATFSDLISEMKKQIKELKKTVNTIIPQSLTLNFFPHDRVLFRLVNKIDFDDENRIFKMKYMDKREGFLIGNPAEPKNIVYDIKELRGLSEEEKKDLAVIAQPGLNYYEYLQNVQDFYILINCSFNLNYWTFGVENRVRAFRQLLNSGVIDQYDMPKMLHVFTKEFVDSCYETMEKLWMKQMQ